MNWPNHSDYSEAIQNPEICFDLPELQTGEVATTPLGLPRALSGNFATVYEVSGGGETHAVRCFIRQVTNQQARYAALQRYLAPLELPFLVPFEFVDRGIRVCDQLLPIVKMEWVSGAPLHTWLEQQLAAKEQIAWLAEDWRELMRSLKEHRIGHGDLQHGNILVTDDGELKLVDYDGVYVPLFARERSPELGHANYQHPQRAPGFYDERLDHFAALLIYLSLRALAAEPALWSEYFNGDNLLATAVDLRVPRCSGLWPRLLKSPDDDVRRLTVLLTDYLRVVPEQIPDLESVLVTELPQVCVPTHLGFDEPVLVNLRIDDRELETTFVSRVSHPLEGPLGARKSEHSPKGTRPAPLPPRFVDVFAWSALVTALIALMPPLGSVAGIAAIVLGLFAWLIPGRIWQRGRWVAAVSALVGLLCVFNAASIRAEARRLLDSAQQPITLHPVKTYAPIAEAQPLQPMSEAATDTFLGEESQLEDQPVSRPLLPPKTRPFVNPLHRWQAHDQPISDVSLSADGRIVIATSKDSFLGFRELATGQTIYSDTNLKEPILAISALTNIGIVVTVDAMHTVQWWSLDGGLSLKSFALNPDSVFLPALSLDGNQLAIGSSDRRSVALHLDRSTGVSRTITGLSSWVKQVKFLPDGKYLAVICHDDLISIAELATGQVRQQMAFPDAAIVETGFSQRPGGFFVAGEQGQLRTWNLAAGRMTGERPPTGRRIAGAGYAQGGRQLIVAHADGLLELLAVADGLPLLARHELGQSLTSAFVSFDGELLATGNGNGEVTVWQLEESSPAIMRLAKP